MNLNIEHYLLYLQGENECICRFAEVSNPQIAKRLGLQIANPQRVTSSEGPQIQRTIEVRKFADLHFAELIYGPHTFAFYTYLQFTREPLSFSKQNIIIAVT